MPFGRFRGLRFEILGNLAVVSLISLVLTGFGVWFINGRHMLRQELHQGRLLLADLAREALPLLHDGTEPPGPAEAVHVEALQALLRRYAEKVPGMGLRIVDADLRELAMTGEGDPRSPALQEVLTTCFRTREPSVRLEGRPRLFGSCRRAFFAFPLQRSGRLLGGVGAVLSLEGALSSTRQTFSFLLVYLLLGSLVFLIFGTVLISRTVVHPLEKTISVMERVADGDLHQKVEPEGDNEMGRLAQTFNAMAGKLKAHQKALQEHLQSLRKMNQELKKTQQEVIQSEKLASVGLLAAGVAHEIGNPLGAVLGYISMLQQDTSDSEERQDYLRRMEKELLRIDGIVRDLKAYSKPSPRRVVPTDLNEIVQDTVRMLKRQRDFREIRFEERLERPLSPVSVDPGQVQQVLVNLFLNAKDAMQGRGTVRVVTRSGRFVPPGPKETAGPARREDDPPGLDYRLLRKRDPARKWPFLKDQEIVEVEVSDTGPGIPSHHLPRVFDPFFTTKEAGRGTGLGLSVSQRIIESFYGDIRMTNGPEAGARVTIRLPVAETEESTYGSPNERRDSRDATAAAHRG